MLQHDNARAHVTPMDPQLKAAFDEYGKDGWSFSLAPQPPNSPDTIILDIGFFAAMQSLQQKKSAKTIDDLVANVGQACDEYPMESLGRTFLSLQACLVETMRLFGDNAYKLHHMGKEKLACQGQLPQNVQCPMDVYDAGMQKMVAQDAAAMELMRRKTSCVQWAK
ncbi:hypothetical protein H310_14744 [Aphanomyces invadans]|uniref:Uncharacterized protein n=1 Tax=Aphanomyces invadans TaxID=157072 RepID=A0A024T913_9STRA|nr:hypothetical protein H310_14744 [Aphanomyces invadans]ETV90464.1 hypothetical protein H310_14744 [Aphanomyces invadans]|eukprot:XP_008880892.1 hypothetical protein H310_14744 [Aphanomyces invadans]